MHFASSTCNVGHVAALPHSGMIGGLGLGLSPLLCCREAIAARQGVPKVLLLNGSHDRETSTSAGGEGGMTAADIVQAVSHLGFRV